MRLIHDQTHDPIVAAIGRTVSELCGRVFVLRAPLAEMAHVPRRLRVTQWQADRHLLTLTGEDDGRPFSVSPADLSTLIVRGLATLDQPSARGVAQCRRALQASRAYHRLLAHFASAHGAATSTGAWHVLIWLAVVYGCAVLLRACG